MNSIALYIHFPYCLYKCHYCDFNSYAVSWKDELEEPYLDALLHEWHQRHAELKPFSLSSIFLGGGTPSLFSPEGIQRLLQALSQSVEIPSDCEITLEANPKTLSAEKLEGFLKAGINRFSVGVQSFEDRYLAPLGRLHTGLEAEEVLKLFHQVGIENFNIDLMFAFPHQTLAEVRSDLEKALALEPAHLSFYNLTLEEGTSLATLARQGKVHLPDSDTQAEMYTEGIRLVENRGLKQYEISNFSKQQRVSKHNLAYWQYESYIGLGAGAVSFLGRECLAHELFNVEKAPEHSSAQEYGFRWTNPKFPADYIKKANTPLKLETTETILQSTARFEFWMMGLRLNKGVSKTEFKSRFGKEVFLSYEDRLSSLKKKGWIEHNDNRIWLTGEGQLMANDVIEAFL